MILLDGVTVVRDRRRILDDVNGELPKTGLTFVVGPNGAGKSTFLEVLGGLVATKCGCVLDGNSKSRLSRKQLRWRSAYLHQRLVLPDRTDVLKYLTCVEKWRHLREKWSGTQSDHPPVAEVFPLVRQLLARDLAAMSWGEKRTVALAATVNTMKDVLLLDEPLAGLHPSLAHQVVSGLLTISQTRLVVVAEHDLQLVEELTARSVAWVIVSGRLVKRLDPGMFVRTDVMEYFTGA